MAEPVTLLEALSRIADTAALYRQPAPVIETDRASAQALASMIVMATGEPRLRHQPDCIAMFDGVKIVARRPEVCKHEVDWREHFGPLAEIWI